MRKLVKLFVILIVCLTIDSIDIVKADEATVITPGGDGATQDANPKVGTSQGNGVGGNYQYTPVGYAFNCSVEASSCTPRYGIYNREVTIGWNLYNVYNTNIEKNGIINNQIIAGMALGVDLYESRSANWWAKGIVSQTLLCEQFVSYSCEVSCYDPKSGKMSTCWSDSCMKPVWIHLTYTSWSQSCQNQANKLAYDLAKADVKKNGASYSLTITDPNDARCGNPDKYAEELKRDGIICNNYSGVDAIPGEITSYGESLKNGGKVTQKYHYQMYGACINVKNGKVRYLNKDETCGADEYYVENDNTSEEKRHWHVFTPLNTKTPDGYTLSLTENSATKQRSDVCEEFINKYVKDYKYTRYIKPLTGSFINNVTADKKKVANGCYFHTILNIPTTQKFYNEEKKGSDSDLVGFNFYYRPIDITNPFPNGVADDSYWKSWYDASKKDPNLSKSFNEITYFTDGIDIKTIREYNSANNYTSWSNMNINGSSNFIFENNFIQRNSTISNNSFYNLGCGPTNMCEYLDSEHTKKNPFYQKECPNTKIGVSCP